MRFVFAAPPRNYTWPKLTRAMKVQDILISYYWFGPEDQHKFLLSYIEEKKP